MATFFVQQWEYKIESYGYDKIQGNMNIEGEQGWEAFGFTYHGFTIDVFYKRPRPNHVDILAGKMKASDIKSDWKS
jgi:hypothetical protein